MTVLRVMGTETEYAVTDRANPRANPVQLSFDVVDGAADDDRRHIRWDYRGEDPVNDARGYRLERASARRDMLTDSPQLQVVNTIAPNGGRIYVDHAHPEYSAPETLDPFQALLYDRAGDRLMLVAAREASVRTGKRIELFRNNVDGKGASWGSHESYQILRSVPFDLLIAIMTPHFVTRQIYCGTGRVGLGERCETAGFQLSQRADYVHAKVGLQTTFDRPIINTRDESHSTDRYRRLHVIVGDANRMDTPEALRLGTTSMIAWLAEHADEVGYDLTALACRLTPADPVEAIHMVSHDLTLQQPYATEGGGTITAWQTQVLLRSAVYEVAAGVYGTDIDGEPLWPDEPTKRIMAMWGTALEDVARVAHADDEERMGMTGAAGRLEWLLKWQLMERLRTRRGLGWNDPKIRAMDIAWAALEPRASVFEAVRAHAISLIDDAALDGARTTAPASTRAWLRAEVVRRFPNDVVAASWRSITVRGGDGQLHDIDIADPGEHTEAACRAMLEPVGTVDDLIRACSAER
ncbi:depupylase/deamidase Dop [Bifidobacterium callimiconis]|uniref:Ligase n=1 Tax=Bifidobacterium callimiconis TaxID=2306973 RepID=A0A430FGH0_9BIFI|nr:depupylase/deamidase Dop [Bifidobacterium callimiconis]MBT1176595.1 proteasome accessory factor PafA2 [Bifidobacterium callimiconis]RSX51949.1 ligase [Bifidobacterium callimiconis]